MDAIVGALLPDYWRTRLQDVLLILVTVLVDTTLAAHYLWAPDKSPSQLLEMAVATVNPNISGWAAPYRNYLAGDSILTDNLPELIPGLQVALMAAILALVLQGRLIHAQYFAVAILLLQAVALEISDPSLRKSILILAAPFGVLVVVRLLAGLVGRGHRVMLWYRSKQYFAVWLIVLALPVLLPFVALNWLWPEPDGEEDESGEDWTFILAGGESVSAKIYTRAQRARYLDAIQKGEGLLYVLSGGKGTYINASQVARITM